MSIGQRIRALRNRRGFTQDKMAEQLGMNRANFSNYERDVAIPPSETLLKIAELLNTSTDHLLGREEFQHAVPDWATAKDKRDLKKMLESPEVLFFDGIEFSETDRAKMMGVMETIFWEAKQRNKENYKKARNPNNLTEN
ncbi:helix-turn-helix domain-containing protein [Paenibacillus sabuli]|uniref:helix-turn-helix domain-containing protein n=1 Tax=Paenibacillus sabuli TaxID=2772509 RepID=UPI00295B071B|nr:helix-turn-helix transcriptional regulator [Paenibacillus sabuli]